MLQLELKPLKPGEFHQALQYKGGKMKECSIWPKDLIWQLASLIGSALSRACLLALHWFPAGLVEVGFDES